MFFISTRKFFIPFLKIFSLLFGYGIIFFSQNGFLWGAIIMSLVTIFLFTSLHPIKMWKKTGGFFFQTCCLDLLVFSSLLFISSTLITFLLIGLHFFLSFIFWRIHFFFWYERKRYEPFSYENIVNVITVFLLYLLGLNGSAFIIFLGILPWIVFASFAIMILAIVMVYFEAHNIHFPQNFFLGMLMVLFSQEIFWALGILPFSFPVIALIFTTILYFIMSIFRFYTLHQLNMIIWKRYAIFTFFVLILTIFTARWN